MMYQLLQNFQGMSIPMRCEILKFFTIDFLIYPFVRKWNQDEDKLLLAAVERFGIGHWKRIAEFVGTKSNGNIRYRLKFHVM